MRLAKTARAGPLVLETDKAGSAGGLRFHSLVFHKRWSTQSSLSSPLPDSRVHFGM
jgi:hypothetical protein